MAPALLLLKYTREAFKHQNLAGHAQFGMSGPIIQMHIISEDGMAVLILK